VTGTVGLTGASGQLGRATADELLRRLEPDQIVLVTRRPDELDRYARAGASVRHGDFDDPPSLLDAFRGIERLLLISAVDMERRVAQHQAAIDAARASGVRHVAYTSILNPIEANPAGAVPSHHATEERLCSSGLAWTLLRNGLYSDFQAPRLVAAAESGRHVHNGGDGKTAYVAREDCAAVAATVLAEDGHEGEAYDVTGPEPLSGADLATIASAVSGKPVEAVAVDDDAYVAGLVEHAGLPEEVARFAASFGRAIREGYVDGVSPDVERLTGRTPQSLDQLIAAQTRDA
jgi:NAD(P)H dehydrogenase (quinone)